MHFFCSAVQQATASAAADFLIWGVGLFALASLACAVAPSLLAAGCAFPAGYQRGDADAEQPGDLGQTFSGEARGPRYRHAWAASGAAAGALGPVLGGWLIDVGSRHLIFLINVPIALAAMALAWLGIPAIDTTATSRSDSLGAILATCGLGLTTSSPTEATSHDWTGFTLGALAAGLLLLLVFVWVEGRKEANAR